MSVKIPSRRRTDFPQCASSHVRKSAKIVYCEMSPLPLSRTAADLMRQTTIAPDHPSQVRRHRHRTYKMQWSDLHFQCSPCL